MRDEKKQNKDTTSARLKLRMEKESATTKQAKKFPQNLKRALQQSGGTAVPQWLRRCATNRKVAGSIPDGVIRIFH